MLAVLSCILALAMPLLVPQISPATPPPQTTQNPLELVQQAAQFYQAASFEKSATLWQQAVNAFAAQKDPLNQAMALSNLSLTYQQLGKWKEANQTINESLNLLIAEKKTPEQQRINAQTLDIQGQLQLATGQPTLALETWQQAAHSYKTLNNPEGVIKSQINQAQAMQEGGLYPRACETLLKALKLDNQDCNISQENLQTFQQKPITYLKILGLRSLGNVLRVLGKTEQSQIVLLTSEKLAQQIGDTQELAAIYLSLGNTARALGNEKIQKQIPRQPPIIFNQSLACIPSEKPLTAAEFYQQAAACYRQVQSFTSPSIKIQAKLNLISLLIQTQQGAELPTLLSQIQSNIAALPPNKIAVDARLKWTQNLICLKSQQTQDKLIALSPLLQQCSFQEKIALNPEFIESTFLPSWQDINQIVTEANQIAQLLGDKKAQANCLGYLGAIYEHIGKLTQAQQFSEQALQEISSYTFPEISYLWYWQLGHLYQLQGNTKKAVSSYTSAFEILQSLRKDLLATNADIQFTFRDNVEPLYRQLVNLLLQSDNPSPEDLKQARDIIEALQVAELNNFFQEACLESKPISADQIDLKAAVIYPIILPERLVVILSVAKQPLRYYSTSFLTSSNPTGEIEATFDDLYATLNPFIATSEPLKPYQQFYDWLIRPAQAELEKNNIKTLVFVPDGILRGLPMAALHDGQQYLIEKYNIAFTPSLQLFSPGLLSAKKLKTLVGGLTEARQGFPALPGVLQEVQDIRELVANETLLNQDFTRKRLQQAIESSQFPIVHLATHGRFSSLADNTFLLTWNERINVKDLDQLLLERERYQQKPLELLILSACQTALGDKRAALGLAGVAVRSGARSTLATLWAVQDDSTAELMAQFYQRLNQPNMTKAAALRQAQLLLLRSPQYEHPFYWAAFVLVGNWL
uniref:Tetratricopeptide domain protein n=2 Tax=Gloeothece TaxID=28070 RepID=E0UFJ7_GLOV7|nr:tetratricopeptide domain protein [Gloeothece verrucosa PCC 7822]